MHKNEIENMYIFYNELFSSKKVGLFLLHVHRENMRFPAGFRRSRINAVSTSLYKNNIYVYTKLNIYVNQQKNQICLAKPIHVRNMIAHIRLATRGGMAYENCHPFVSRDCSGRAWTLAHNGTIFQSELLDSYRSVQDGSTDSERILCHIIKVMNNAGAADQEQRFQILDQIILDIAEHNKLNLLIFDGEILYVHTNMRGTLYRTERKGAALFATTPLDERQWEPMPMMQLLAYRDGKLIASGTKHTYEYHRPDAMLNQEHWAGL